MSNIVEQCTAELHATRQRAQQLEEIARQALALLSVAPATMDEVNAWYRAVAIVQAKYALVTSPGKTDNEH